MFAVSSVATFAAMLWTACAARPRSVVSCDFTVATFASAMSASLAESRSVESAASIARARMLTNAARMLRSNPVPVFGTSARSRARSETFTSPVPAGSR